MNTSTFVIIMVIMVCIFIAIIYFAKRTTKEKPEIRGKKK